MFPHADGAIGVGLKTAGTRITGVRRRFETRCVPPQSHTTVAEWMRIGTSLSSISVVDVGIAEFSYFSYIDRLL